jgi:hypothetical protein
MTISDGDENSLQSLGEYVPVRQKGNHVFLRHPDGRSMVVPLHEVNKSTSSSHYVVWFQKKRDCCNETDDL